MPNQISEAATLPASAATSDTAALIVTGKGGRERMDSEPKTVT
jgi:site-specific recombinase XerD